MARHNIARAVTGLAAGALLTTMLLGILALGWLAKITPLPFAVFGIKNTAKTAEQVLAVALLFLVGLVIGLLFFVFARSARKSRIEQYGLAVGGAVGLFSVFITLVRGLPDSVAAYAVHVVWVLALFVLWGWGLARLYLATFSAAASLAEPPSTDLAGEVPGGTEPVSVVADMPAQAEAHVISRRRFIIQMGGLAATIIVVGAGVGDVLRARDTPEMPGPVGTPVTFPNADSPVQPVPGTRPEYTPVADHYRVDIGLTSPEIDGTAWRLTVDGLVTTPLSLTLEKIKSEFKAVDQFVTLSCISNPLGGPLIGTTQWTGVRFRDLLAQAGLAAGARYAHIKSADGFDEEVDLELVNGDPRVILAYAWDGQPLPRAHGFPLRIFVPDRYGMKQPKWVTGITLTAESTPGYWVARGWDEKAEVKTTAVIDTVAIKSLVTRGSQTYVPIGGIAYAGAKGISKVEIQLDEAAWQPAQLREPLSELTWVIWRYDWPFSEGTHRLAVRAYDRQGRLQETEETVSHTGSAVTGLYTEQITIPPTPAPGR